MRITRLFVLLALAALLAPRAEASRTSVWERTPPSSLTATKTDAASALASLAPAAHLDTSTAADSEIVGSSRFNLGDVVLVERELVHEERFHLGPLTLVDLNPLRGPPPSYPETRVRGFELLPPFRVGASPALSLWTRQACGFSCREVASDSRYDPWGLMEEMASYSGMATAGYSQEEILQQAARDRASAAAAGKAQLALIGGVSGAGWLSRTWAAVKETWQIGVGLKAVDWLRVNQQNLSNLGQDVLEAVNPGPSPLGLGPRAPTTARTTAPRVPLALPPAKVPLALPAADMDSVIAANYQRYINDAAESVVTRFNKGRIPVPAGMPWQTVLGQEIDSIARGRMRNFLEREGIAEGPGADVLVNRFLRDPSGSGRYRIPDLRLNRSRRILDGTIGAKGPDSPQIVDFGDFSGGYEVEIVRPKTGPLSRPR